MHVTAQRDGYFICTDPGLIDLDAVHAYLARSYWARNIPRGVLERAIRGSMVFGLYEGTPITPANRVQVGLARVVTDRATYAYLCDVYVLEAHRSKGLGKWLVSVVVAHPELQGLRRFCLMTRDAHGLYEPFGFTPMRDPSRYMEVYRPGVYAPPDEAMFG